MKEDTFSAIEEYKKTLENADKKEDANTQLHDDSSQFHFTTNIADAQSRHYRDFVLHIFCTAGSAKVRMVEKEFKLTTCCCLVILNNSTFRWLETSPDFRMRGVFISNNYMTTSSPDTNYNTMGMLSLMENPVIKMKQEEFDQSLAVCDAIRARLSQHDHIFYEGILRRCVETLILDLYNIRQHSMNGTRSYGNQGMRLFRKFISMLEKGDFKEQREVRWYAKELGITPKYLSEICLNASGHGASYWINQFTTEEIARLLHNPTMTINSIADLLNFNTRSYFSHYVKERLGLTPKDYRLKVLGLK